MTPSIGFIKSDTGTCGRHPLRPLHKKAPFFVAFFLALVAWGGAFAQPRLALVRKDAIIARFEEGEYIRFQKKGGHGFIRAMVTGIHPGYFMLGTDTVRHYEVAQIDIRHKTTASVKVAPMGGALMVAGALLAAIDAFNTAAVQDRPYKVGKGVGLAALALIGVGGTMQVWNNNYFKIGPKRKLATLDYP